jgi:hypothetical protein
MKKLLLMTLAAIAGIGFFSVASAYADSPSEESSFVARINALRATKGLAPLAVDANLTSKARGWAQTMADKDRIWHSALSDGVTADWERLGENVGMGATVDSLHIAFVNSPHHYENLVDPTFRSIGIGVVYGPTGTLFVSEVFMLARTVAPAPTTLPPTPAVLTAVTSPAVKPAAVRAPPVTTPPVTTPKPVPVTTPTTVLHATAIRPAPDGDTTPSRTNTHGRRAVPRGQWIREF